MRLWENSWAEFTPFLAFDTEIRRVVCSTNPIESVNARIRRAVRARSHFPNEQAALKCVYLTITALDHTGESQRRWITRWKAALNAFDITFDGRLTAYSSSSLSPDPHHLAVLARPGFVGAAPTLPGTTRIRLPSAPPTCYDRPEAGVSHLHSKHSASRRKPKVVQSRHLDRAAVWRAAQDNAGTDGSFAHGHDRDLHALSNK